MIHMPFLIYVCVKEKKFWLLRKLVIVPLILRSVLSLSILGGGDYSVWFPLPAHDQFVS